MYTLESYDAAPWPDPVTAEPPYTPPQAEIDKWGWRNQREWYPEFERLCLTLSEDLITADTLADCDALYSIYKQRASSGVWTGSGDVLLPYFDYTRPERWPYNRRTLYITKVLKQAQAMGTLKDDLAACQLNRTKLQQQVADLTTLTEQLKAVASDLGAQSEAQKGEIQKARAEAVQAAQARDAAVAKLGPLQDRIVQLEQERQGAATAAKQVASDVADLQARLADAQAVAAQLPGVQAQLAQLQAQAQEAMSGREASMAELQQLRVAHEMVLAQLQQAQSAASQVTGLQADLAQAKADLAQAQQAAMAAAQARDAALQQAENAQRLAETAQAKITEAVQKAQTAEQARRGLELQAQQVQADLVEAQDAVQTLMTALAMTQRQVELAKTRMALVPTDQIAAGELTKAGFMGLPPWAVIAGLGAAAVYAITHARTQRR